MPIAQNTTTAGAEKPRLKPGRRPLQPKNIFTTAENESVTYKEKESKPKPEIISLTGGEFNKENRPIELFDASLAEELSAIRKRVERLRLDRERTEEMLKERDRAMDLKMEEIFQRGETQKTLEIEVDRLFRLKELQSYSTRISPIKSLREKEQEKRNNVGLPISLDLKAIEAEESEGDENMLQSTSSTSSDEL